MKANDLTGRDFELLHVQARVENSPDGKTRWICTCECGAEVTVRGSDLLSGRIKSCGCIRRMTAAKQGKKNATHGGTNTRLYTEWCCMLRRCKAHHNYKGRGIEVCQEWRHSFEAFRDWALANGYQDNLTIERKNTDGNYCPENCRWATMKEQQNNRRNNRVITYNGKTQTLAMWADETGIRAETIRWRIKAGWPESDLFMPVNLNNARIRKDRNKNAQ